MKRCPRCGETDPSAFGTNRAVACGLTTYCRKCNRERMAESRKLERAGIVKRTQRKTVKQTHAEKVELAISLGYRTWAKLRRSTGLTADEIGIALAELIFDKRSVRPRTINGERFYVRRAA